MRPKACGLKLLVHAALITCEHLLLSEISVESKYIARPPCATCTAFCVSICTFVPVKRKRRRSSTYLRRRLQRQNLYFCTSNASKLSTSSLGFHFVLANMPLPLQVDGLRRQYLYFCTSKASKLSTCPASRLDPRTRARGPVPQLRQYLYFCTSRASKVSKVSTHLCRSELLCGHVPHLLRHTRQYLYFCTA